MGSFSIWHWLIVLAIVLILFGTGGKIPRLMRDLGQGVTAFRKGLKEEKPADTTASTGPKPVAADTENQKDKMAS